MNKVFPKFLITILLICWLFPIRAQVVLQGKTIDAESGQGIPYASVQIVNSTYGTACNKQGKFLIKIDSVFYRDTLKISCIGYLNGLFPIQNQIKNSMRNSTFRLDPSTVYLDEVKITGTRQSPEEFLKEAVDVIPKNYTQQPFNMEIYSRMSVQDSNEVTQYQIESILLTHSEGYLSGSRNYYKIRHKRETGTMPLPFQDYIKDDKEYFPFTPGHTVAAFDQLGWGTEASTIFNSKYHKKLDFKYAGISVFDQDTVIAIEYSSRKKGSKMNGTIYIALNNLAFIKHSLQWGITDQEIIYKNVNGNYFPYSIISRRPVTHNKTNTLVDEIFITNIELDNITPLEKRFDQWYPKGVPYDEEFWNSNYPLD